jgi:hypothetical protein
MPILTVRNWRPVEVLIVMGRKAKLVNVGGWTSAGFDETFKVACKPADVIWLSDKVGLIVRAVSQ